MADGTTEVCDHYLQEFRTIRDTLGREGVAQPPPDEVTRRVAALSEEQARRLLALASSSSEREVAAVLQAHPLHREVILQSSILKHALDKPRGYAGDMELMLKICQGQTGPSDGLADHLDAFYAALPASQAVRDRVAMLGRIIDDLPEGSRILNLACGPALEVQSHVRRRPDSTLSVDLVDHDAETLRYLSERVSSGRVQLLQGNAFRLLAGDLRVRRFTKDRTHPDGLEAGDAMLAPVYDLIYSAGLYDYIPDGHGGRGGVGALTAVLFSLLKPGGHLLVGNYLRPSPTSRHQPHHRAMMELYSQWKLRYRDMDQIRAFAAHIGRPHTVELVDETGQLLRSTEQSVIGFAAIRAL